MEFNDKPPSKESDPQFEIVLQTQEEHEAVVAAIADLTTSIMSGEAASVSRTTEDYLVDYLSQDPVAQSHITVTPARAIHFARLIRHGAILLPKDKRDLAVSLSKSIEQEAIVRDNLTDLDDI